MSLQYFEGVGRRKEATARVRVMKGSGNIVVNDRKIAEYFTREGDLAAILLPLAATGEAREQLDISVVVSGGGVSGQTSAVQLGLARALLKLNPEYRLALRKAGCLTRDAREKERKKPGLKRARKAPTYTKR